MIGASTTVLADLPRKNLVRVVTPQSLANGTSPWRLETAPGAQATLVNDSGPGNTLALRLDYPAQPVPAGAVDPLAASAVTLRQDAIALNVSDPYTLSFWVRGADISGRTVRVILDDDSGHPYIALAEAVYATSEWKHYTFSFQWWLNQAPTRAALKFTLAEHGTLWIAGVEIVCEAHPAARFNPRVSAAESRNLVPNSSFETGSDGWTTLSARTGWSGPLVGLYGSIVAEAPFDGQHCLKIELGPDKSPVTYSGSLPTAYVVQNSLLAANKGWIDIVPGKVYTLSAYLKASRPGVEARLNIRQAGGAPMAELPPSERKVTLTEKWERYAFSLKAQANQACIAVGPDITNSPDTPAIVWLDAIQFEAGEQPTVIVPHEALEVGFEVGPRDHIFLPGEPITVRVSAANTQPQSSRLQLRASVRDYFGRVVAQPKLTLEVPAGSTTQQTWSLGAWGKGIFFVAIDWGPTDAPHRTELRVAALDAYPAQDSIFGINHAPPSAELCAMVKKAGIRWARDWSLNWGFLEPKPGQLSFEASDIQLNRLQRTGFNIICLTPALPSTNWSSAAPDSVAANLWDRMGYLPKDTGQLLEFVRKAIEHTRDRVHTWEFLNEPIWTGFCMSQEDFNKPESRYVPADYVKLLKQVYPVMKAADPQGRVIGGFAAQPWHFAREFVALGGLEFVDTFNIHNYGTYLPPEAFIGDMTELSRLMTTHGGRKPIWLTEYSYYGADVLPWEPWTPPTDSWAANLLLKDERQCADWTIRYNLIMLANGVEKIFYHSGVTGEPNSLALTLECAMLAEGGEPRKLFAAQATLAQILGPDCRFSGQLALDKTIAGHSTFGLHGYAFQCDRRAVMPVWATEAAAKQHIWQIVVPRDVHAVDLMGNPILGDYVALDTSPIYLISETLSASQLAKACAVSPAGQGGLFIQKQR